MSTDKPRCPEQSTIGNGDESMEICCLSGTVCLLESGTECETYNEFLAKCDAEFDIAYHDQHLDEVTK